MPIITQHAGSDRGKHAYDTYHGLSERNSKPTPPTLRKSKGRMAKGHKRHGKSPRPSGRI